MAVPAHSSRVGTDYISLCYCVLLQAEMGVERWRWEMGLRLLNREVSWLKLIFPMGDICQSLPHDTKGHRQNHPQPAEVCRDALGVVSCVGGAEGFLSCSEKGRAGVSVRM